METTTPNLSFFFAIHRKMRSDTARYVRAVATATESDRQGRLSPLARWSKGFVHELEEHHFVEDTYFFPDLRNRVPVAGPILDRIVADHRALDELLGRWPAISARLTSAATPFMEAKQEAHAHAVAMHELLLDHLDVEDNDILPLFWRHYSAAEYDTVYERAVKNGKKRGLGFVIPWNVDCVDGDERAALMAVAPLPLKLLWYGTRRRYARLVADAFGAVVEAQTGDAPLPAPRG
ncbi:MAG: hemerythrin domain-containing protein [Acidimicrobiales bacterium]